MSEEDSIAFQKGTSVPPDEKQALSLCPPLWCPWGLFKGTNSRIYGI